MLVDGQAVVQAGPLAPVGILPTLRKVVEVVRARLASAPAVTPPFGGGG